MVTETWSQFSLLSHNSFFISSYFEKRLIKIQRRKSIGTIMKPINILLSLFQNSRRYFQNLVGYRLNVLVIRYSYAIIFMLTFPEQKQDNEALQPEASNCQYKHLIFVTTNVCSSLHILFFLQLVFSLDIWKMMKYIQVESIVYHRAIWYRVEHLDILAESTCFIRIQSATKHQFEKSQNVLYQPSMMRLIRSTIIRKPLTHSTFIDMVSVEEVLRW